MRENEGRVKMIEASFRLKDSFVARYKNIKPPFGFNGLGELVYNRTYSRIRDDGTNEKWYETVRRVVEGTYRMQERHIISNDLGWNDARAQKSAQEMYDRMFYMKFLPPGRGLWAMGSPMTEERGLYASLFNCAFTSTGRIDKEFDRPFTFVMEASMLGIGVGFDTKGEEKLTILQPGPSEEFIIPDTREGWVKSLSLLLRAYFIGEPMPIFDYSVVRPSGLPIKGFGGISSGPRPLKDMHDSINNVLVNYIGKLISITNIVDIMNLIGKCVVAGNIRRTALIGFGEKDNDEFMDLKNYDINPQRESYGWTSNNSIFPEIGMDYSEVSKRTKANGEPGYMFLENMQSYGKMDGIIDKTDNRVLGSNPCGEQQLEHMECCNLVETFPNMHDNLDDYLRTLKFAYLYAKTVTLSKTPWQEANRVMLRNRRIGCSMSGVQQFIAHHNLNTLKEWCETGYETIQRYDRKYSEWLAIPKSIRTTSVKPSGTVSLVAGATPGMHWPESKHYIRRMRLSKHSELIKPLQEAGYHIEPAFGSENDTLVVSIPVEIKEDIRTVSQVSMWEQLAMAAFLQRYWADNQVSVSVTFDPDTEGNQIASALNYYQYQLKGVSFLPKTKKGAFPQMPYEEISESSYNDLVRNLGPLSFNNISAEEADVERFCDGSSCTVKTA